MTKGEAEDDERGDFSERCRLLPCRYSVPFVMLGLEPSIHDQAICDNPALAGEIGRALRSSSHRRADFFRFERPVAVFVLLARAAGAGFVAADATPGGRVVRVAVFRCDVEFRW